MSNELTHLLSAIAFVDFKLEECGPTKFEVWAGTLLVAVVEYDHACCAWFWRWPHCGIRYRLNGPCADWSPASRRSEAIWTVKEAIRANAHDAPEYLLEKLTGERGPLEREKD